MKATPASTIAVIIDAYNNGARVNTIAESVGVNRATVFKYLRTLKVPKRSIAKMRPFVIFNGLKYGLYGKGYYRRPGTPPTLLHRAIWESVHGPITPGHHVHHKDGNPINNDISNLECKSPPDHASYHHKGKTGSIGSMNSSAKLTEEQAADIRRRYRAKSESQRQLAAEFGVSQSLISLVVRGNIWKSVNEAPILMTSKKKVRLNGTQKTAVRASYAEGGHSQKQLADEYNVSQSEIQKIVTFKS